MATTAVTSTSARPAAGPPPPPPPASKFTATPTTVSFRSLLLGNVEDPLLSSPLVLAAPPPPPIPSPPPGGEHGAPQPPGPDASEQQAPAEVVVVHTGKSREDDMLDPLHRQRLAMGPPEMSSSGVVATAPGMVGGTAPPEVVRAQASMEDLLPAMVRRVQWGGDGRKGTVRMEISAGALAGSTLLISADAGRVSVRLDVPPGVDAAGWKDRIQGRLAVKHIPTDEIEVT